MDFIDEDPFVFQPSYPPCNNNHTTYTSSISTLWNLFFGANHFGRRCFGMFEFHQLLPVDWYNHSQKNKSAYNHNVAAVIGMVTLFSLLVLHTFRYINLKSSKNVLYEFLRLSKKDVSLFGGTTILIYILFSLFSEKVAGYLYIMKFEIESFQHTFGEMIKGLAVILLYRMQVLIALSKIPHQIGMGSEKEVVKNTAIDVYSCFIEIPWIGVIVLLMMGLFFPSSSFLSIVLLAWGSLISVASIHLFCHTTAQNTNSDTSQRVDLISKREDTSNTQTSLDSEKKNRKKKKQNTEIEEEEEENGEQSKTVPRSSNATELFAFDLNWVSTILQWLLVFHAWYITFVIQQLGKSTNHSTLVFFVQILSGVIPYILAALIYIPSTISLLPFCTHILKGKIKTQ
eukprot:TRINITY_DN272_c0_g1_i1.p1 TRINITY_DN272_c0_g1~~TRINITY_DN272_c0_g1_i1.p1  ORF type:complete len:399 (+),score=61.43 TRINITY_DN272_c0_g1_i1:196-1392(+)